jgi:hypothetical protein
MLTLLAEIMLGLTALLLCGSMLCASGCSIQCQSHSWGIEKADERQLLHASSVA